MGNGVPVDSIFCAMLQREPELVVEVQHVHVIDISQSPAEEVGFNHVKTQLGNFVLNLWSIGQRRERLEAQNRQENQQRSKNKSMAGENNGLQKTVSSLASYL